MSDSLHRAVRVYRKGTRETVGSQDGISYANSRTSLTSLFGEEALMILTSLGTSYSGILGSILSFVQAVLFLC